MNQLGNLGLSIAGVQPGNKASFLGYKPGDLRLPSKLANINQLIGQCYPWVGTFQYRRYSDRVPSYKVPIHEPPEVWMTSHPVTWRHTTVGNRSVHRSLPHFYNYNSGFVIDFWRSSRKPKDYARAKTEFCPLLRSYLPATEDHCSIQRKTSTKS